MTTKKKARKVAAKKPPAIAVEAAQPPQREGIECPACGCQHVPVIYTRPRLKRAQRLRECRHCGRRFTTWESAS